MCLQEDAGADFTFEFPYPTLGSASNTAAIESGDEAREDLNGWLDDRGQPMLLPEHLPDRAWPWPNMEEAVGGSPLSRSAKDYLRPAGPGLLVGCAYRARIGTGGALQYNEEDCVFFALARRTSKEEYLRGLAESSSSEED